MTAEYYDNGAAPLLKRCTKGGRRLTRTSK
jgi:hypothetical protein